MSQLYSQIQADYITAFKAKDTVKKNLLGEIKTELVLIEKQNPVQDTDVISSINKAMKKIQATIDTCPAGRDDVLTQANQEKAILLSYLPTQMTPQEVETFLTDALNSGKVEKNMGALMKYGKTELAGKCNMQDVSTIVKNLLT